MHIHISVHVVANMFLYKDCIYFLYLLHCIVMLSSECHVLSAESTAALHAHYMHACIHTCTLLMLANQCLCLYMFRVDL